MQVDLVKLIQSLSVLANIRSRIKSEQLEHGVFRVEKKPNSNGNIKYKFLRENYF